MPDWKSEASRKLECAKLSADEREEISRELAGYLDDLCSQSRASGADESSATARGKQELNEDPRLGTTLYHARQEGRMNDRTRQLWIPAITLLLASAAMLALFQLAALWLYSAYAPTPHGNSFPGLMAWLTRHNSAALIVYLGWLYTLPFLGAFGAGWARRAGSSIRTQITSGLFPLLLFIAIFFGQYHVATQGTTLNFLGMDALPPSHIFFLFMPANVSLFLSWVAFPMAALLLGVLPFLLTSAESSQQTEPPISA